MNIKQMILAGALAGCSLLTSACASQAYVAYRVPPPPGVPMVLGPAGYAPGPGYVWVDGFWDLRGSRWVWAPGRWAYPPHARAVWVRSYWEPHGSSWRFHSGHWR